MRKLLLFFTVFILATLNTMASTTENKLAIHHAYTYNTPFIFVENGITFSVYPDGEFDFYINSHIGRRNRNITFNSGFDYSPFTQYDDYGAVIQIENVPIYYDHFGRVAQIGSIDINYRNGRLRRLGGMHIFYNNRGFFDHYTGYVNIYNRDYIYRPFHSLFVRPSVGFCFVYNKPYRRYYTPIRYTYYSPYRYNTRRTYARIGREHRYNRIRRERSNIYRNDKRVAVNNNRNRSNRTIFSNNDTRTKRTNIRNNITRSNRTIVSNDKNYTHRSVKKSNVDRTNRKVNQGHRKIRNNNANRGKTVIKREVTRIPSSRTVKRTTTYKKPMRKSSVSNSPSRSRNVVARSSSTRTVKAPVRNSRNFSTRSRARL